MLPDTDHVSHSDETRTEAVSAPGSLEDAFALAGILGIQEPEDRLQQIHARHQAASVEASRLLQETLASLRAEIDRLPETVISRCQVFNFKKPDLKTLKDFVIDTVKKEGYQIDNSAAELVALTGDGSFRDTHGVLEKVLRNSSGEDKKITEDDAFESTGAPRSALVRDIIEAISKREVSKALAKVREAEEQNVSMATLFTLLVMRMRYSMLLRYAPELESSIKSELTDEDFKLLSSIGSEKDSIINSKTLGVFLEMHPMIGKTAIPSLPIELAIIKSISG